MVIKLASDTMFVAFLRCDGILAALCLTLAVIVRTWFLVLSLTCFLTLFSVLLERLSLSNSMRLIRAT